MRDFLKNRDRHLIPERVSLQEDPYNETLRWGGILDALLTRANQIEDSVNFLESNTDAVEAAVNDALTVTENRIAFLTSSVIGISKMKAVAPGLASEMDIELIDLVSGEYNNMAYSASDGGIVMSSMNTLAYR